MPAPLFKRWAPPAPVTSTPVSSKTATPAKQANDAESIETLHTSHTIESAVASPQPDPRDSSPIEAPKSIKKPKKRKHEAEAHEEEHEVSKKHKAIFSKFEKASKLSEAKGQRNDEEVADAGEQEELHDLQPMPQPAPVAEPVFEPTFSTLPSWLAQPVTVESSKTVPFADLGVLPFYTKRLDKLGFKEALAVQTALLPMLQPGYEQHLGDICVSAKTGSGKTLAYLLPIIEALRDRVVPIMSAIVVVPTRQLVHQAVQVAEELCAGTKIKVGTALGNVPFATEQKQLVKLQAQYDPLAAKALHERAAEQYRSGFVERTGLFHDLNDMPVDHVPRYDSAVDILICTPGRLVEHIEHTTGFLLNSVKWLVIDEADQLLNQNFQGWATVLMDALHGETPADFMTARERIRKREYDANSIWSVALPSHRQVTKVVLSATMEKDLTKLGTLRLRRPKLVVVENEVAEPQLLANEDNSFELPSQLDEFAVHVGDGTNKPLHLLHILRNYPFAGMKSGVAKDGTEPKADAESDTDSSSDSDSDSDSSSSSSSESEEEDGTSVAHYTSRVLIFTKSTESASRLSHLLSVLEPSFKPYLKTMTRALTADASRKMLRSFSTGAIRILIASDAASRGLDIPSITHVINYDLPTSITSYVHRVGRTARAGKHGEAWTLFTKTEAAWFLKQITKGDNMKRGSKKVKRMDWKESAVTADGMKKAYREALKQLESAVAGTTEAE